MKTEIKHQIAEILLTAITLLFFFQLLTEFVEAVYLFGLLGSDIPPEIMMVLLFVAPVLLFLFRNQISDQWVKWFAIIGFAARSVEITLPTQGRMIVSGIGMAALMLYMIAVLAKPRSSEMRYRFSKNIGYALPLMLFSSILARALHSGSDLFAYGMFKLITWMLAFVGIFIVLQGKSKLESPPVSQSAHKGRITAYALGITSIFISLYFSFTTPNVMARWGNVSQISVFILVMSAWFITGFWVMRGRKISTKWQFIWGLGYSILLLLSILPHQVKFPPMVDGGYPLQAPQIGFWHTLPLYLTILLSPILLINLISYLDGIQNEQPNLINLAGSFGLAGLYLLIMVLAQVFTTVYDYIPVIGPFFRDKFWLVMFIPAVGAVLPILLPAPNYETQSRVTKRFKNTWIGIALGLILIAVGGKIIQTANPTPPSNGADQVRVFTYNIQQGYNEYGERNFDGQIKLIQSKYPDIVGLQECDTARIAGGNADVVSYFADRLNMYSYYGPSPVAGTFGVALLSRYPIENARTFYLFSLGEQVGVIEADITIGEITYKVYVTHLGNSGPVFQQEQLLELMRGKRNVIAMGDFNFRHYEEQYEITVAEYDDAFIHAQQQNIPDDFNIEERIDHVFVSQGMPVLYVEYLTQPESDHPGLFTVIDK